MGTIYRCLIVDDETPAHKALAVHISKCPDLEHSGSAYNGMEALKMLNDNTYDIIFLDINMPVISGVEVMELQPNRPITIVTTAYSDFALSAYQNHAVDYLLKPISFEKFEKAVEKARIYYSGNVLQKEIQVNQRVFSCKINGEPTEIPLDEILYVESTGNYLKLYRNRQNLPIVIYGTLLSLTETIKSDQFIQVHRTYIVNKNLIKAVGQNSLTMTNLAQLPIGRKYKILLSGFI